MLFATCLTAAEKPARKMACCAAMQDCSDVSVQSSCCIVPSSAKQAVLTSKPVDHQALASVLVATLPALGEPVARPHDGWRVSQASPSPPGVPTYLLVSSLRI